MKTLTNDTFSQALTGNSLVFFHRLKGCGNCDKMLPKIEAFTKEGVNVYDVDVDVDAEKELTNQYAPDGRWNLPLLVYMENGKVINTRTEIVDPMEVTKTLQNISEMELAEIKLNLDIELAAKRKEMFNVEKALEGVNAEFVRRNSKAEPVATPTPKPDLSDLPEAPEDACEGCA